MVGGFLFGNWGYFLRCQLSFVMSSDFSWLSIFLVFAGIALISLSSAVSSLLFIIQSPSPSEKRPRWLLLALGIGVVMTILGMIGIF